MLTGCPTCTQVGEAAGAQQAAGSAGHGGRSSPARGSTPRTVVTVLVAGTGGRASSPGLFGVGGGFVIVPALALALKLPMPEAIGTSLLVIAINSAVALTTRLGYDAASTGHVTLPFTIAAVGGVLVGGQVADRLDAERSLRWFAALLVAVALYTATRAVLALT